MPLLVPQVQHLKDENVELRKLTTDEDKTILLWKAQNRDEVNEKTSQCKHVSANLVPPDEVRALSKQCEALQVQPRPRWSKGVRARSMGWR